MASIELSTFDEGQKRFADLLALINSLGHHVHPSSVLAGMRESVDAAMAAYSTQRVSPDLNVHRVMHDFLNAKYLTDIFLGEQAGPLRDQVNERLEYLTCGDPRLLQQAERSRERNLLVEVIVAATCRRFCTDVRFEEPDVTACFRGRRWGVACKNPSGKPTTTMKLIKEGVRQVRNSDVDVGLVLLHSSHVLRRRGVWMASSSSDSMEYRSFRTAEAAAFDFDHDARLSFEPIGEEIRSGLQRKCFVPTTKVRCALFLAMGPTIVSNRYATIGACVHAPFHRDMSMGLFVKQFNRHFQRYGQQPRSG